MSVVKNKTTGKWDAWFYVRNSDGSLRKKAKKGFKTKSEAKEYEMSHRHDSFEITNITLSDMFDLRAKSCKATKKTSELHRRKLEIRSKELWNVPICKISKQMLIDWRSNLDEELSTSTKNFLITIMKQVFKYANNVYDIPDVSKVLTSFPKKLEDIDSINIITYEDFKRALSVEDDETVRVMLQFLFMTGCRKGEARALLKTDFDGSKVEIYKSMDCNTDEISTTKTKNRRTVYLDKDTAEKIKILCRKEGKYLFGGDMPVPCHVLKIHFDRDLQISQLPKMRIHDLRHSNVSMLWNAGVPVPEISKRIGHSNPKITMERYSHIFDKNQSASVDFLNSLVK